MYGLDMDTFSFDVMSSTHDLLQDGQCEPFRSRVILSSVEFDLDTAHETAALWGMSGKGDRMTTNVLLRV